MALAEPHYMVTLLGPGKRFIIAPKLADVILQLERDKPLEEAARELSRAWELDINSEDLRFIIEQQLIPRGLAYPRGEAPADVKTALKANRQEARDKKSPLYVRLLFGRFRWLLLKRKHVRKVCSSLSVFYEPLSVFLALVLIVSSRYLLYSTAGSRYLRQVVARATPDEYLTGLAFLVTVVLIHEFGHAAAQVRYGLNTGMIGFQLYHYIPAFYADVSNSWKLKPRQRMVVDIGGIYFQSIAASVLCLIYLKTEFVPMLATVMASDMLCIVSLNPFLRFDGYWLLTDALAVPNLRDNSEKVLSRSLRRLFGRAVEPPSVQVGAARTAILALYAVVRNAFWMLLAFFILRQAPRVYGAASLVISKFFAGILKGIEMSDWALFLSSAIRLVLSVLLVMTMISLIAGVGLKLFNLLRKAAMKVVPRPGRAQTAGDPVQE
jgi:putative peptide zinc metalloprotease protein